MEITVLCKVVDNYGDVGVTWRMVNQLISLSAELKINYIIDDLDSFNKICSEVDPKKDFQNVCGIDVYNWKAEQFCYDTFRKNDGEKLSVILECFQCGRPDWMEKILFEDKLERTVNIIMIDYLTAEKYADDFHCLKSLTRSSKVQKVNFMPGFTEKTGGLIIDEKWKKLPEINKNNSILVFTYERDWSPFVQAIEELRESQNYSVKVAQGRGYASFMDSVNLCAKEKSFYESLNYLNQNEWDDVMRSCSVLFIRGEESMSRACLSGISFVWHAYPQSDEYQLVKVRALLERMKKHFIEKDYLIVEKVWIDINSPAETVNAENFKNHIVDFIKNARNLEYGFRDFALSLQKNGDLCANLMTFINKICIIN